MKNRISFFDKLAVLTVVSGLSIALSPISTTLAAPPSTSRVSVSSTGEESNGYSFGWSFGISGNGQLNVFTSSASNLVPGDNNNNYDVFVHNLKTGITKRISIDSSGNESNGYSALPAISASGRFVAFDSNATNLVESDNNNLRDVFIRQRW